MDRSVQYRAMPATARIVQPDPAQDGTLGAVAARFLLRAQDGDGDVSLIEHPLPPRALTAPLHRHSREDEFTYVLEGRVGVQLGDEVSFAGPGSLIVKPRGQWHALWNATDEPARILEVIAPAGLETLFELLPEMPTDGALPDLEAIGRLTAEYGVEFDFLGVVDLVEAHGVRFGPFGA